MQAHLLEIKPDGPRCCFELWDNENKRMTTFNDIAVAKIGNHYLCLGHLAQSILCMNNLEMHDIPATGFKVGKEIEFKEAFLKRAKENYEKTMALLF
jgi:hypothetical protein